MKLGKNFLSAVFFMLTVFSMFVSAFADEKLTVNNTNVSKGDTVTFEYYMSGVKDPIEAAGAYITFNPEFLEYIDGSIGFNVLENAMMNVGEDSIYYCAINVTEGFDFNDEGLVVTASFKVLDTASGSTIISNSFDEIFTFENEEEDLSPEDYTARQVIKVNDNLENKNTHSGIKAADVTETSDIVTNSAVTQSDSDTKNGISTGLIAALVIVFLAVTVGIFALLKKKKSKK